MGGDRLYLAMPPPIFQVSPMQLLERESALAALGDARLAAERGEGAVAVVSGEPGIGKTALVTSFIAALPDETNVLLGTCDDLSIARPLGPFSDFVGAVSAPLEDAILGGAPPEVLHPLLIAELSPRARPTVLVLEDLHWADEATLDAVTFLARRVGALHAMLILTLRSGEVAPDHPLYSLLGDVAAANPTFVELSPLSADAVAVLAGENGDDVFAATGGNPFYVTELLAARDTDEVPASVAYKVVGRTSRLDERSRRLVELIAVVPRRVPTTLLDRVFPEWPYAASEPERRHLLDVRPRYVSFRHELARAAVHAAIPAAVRRRLHAQILDGLLEVRADPAEIVHHAEAAGAEPIVAEHALAAARRAAWLGSKREAHAHYRRALDFLDRLPLVNRATVLEEAGEVAYHRNRLPEAFEAFEHASAIWRDLDRPEALGRCTRVLSRLHWFSGDGARARELAAQAVDILEPLGDSHELGCAYSGFAQLSNVAGDLSTARVWADRALDVGTRVGSEEVRVHALVTLASCDIAANPTDIEPLRKARALADAAHEWHEAVRATGNLGHILLGWGLPREAAPFVDDAVAHAAEHEVRNMQSYAEVTRAWLRLRAGEWEEAERVATVEAAEGRSVSSLLARTVLAELALRRGDADVDERLRRLEAEAERAGDLQRIVPVLEMMTERALLDGSRPPVDRLRSVIGGSPDEGRWVMRLHAIAALAGVDVPAGELPESSPYTLVARRDWAAAADAFGANGWEYDRALMLVRVGSVEAVREALEIARRLRAEPLVRRATQRLRELGARVPRGPYGAARANRAGLTGRQLEVLRLLVDGRTNAEIADELVVSLRTAEHHVAAVLAKLGAATRRDAARRAGDLGLQLAA
jgi:DNA-binding CsgD family transcriptional regulator/tetratricopeptide (TPR) repeat protein